MIVTGFVVAHKLGVTFSKILTSPGQYNVPSSTSSVKLKENLKLVGRRENCSALE